MKVARGASDSLVVAGGFSGLGEGQILLHSPHVRCGHECDLAQLTLALAGLFLEDVALALMAAQNLARTGNLESLGNSLTGLVNTCLTGHGASTIHQSRPIARKICNLRRYSLVKETSMRVKQTGTSAS